MSIEDHVHDAMLRRDWSCTRCRQPAVGWADVDTGEGGLFSYLMCSACVTDFKIFMSTPPEMPDQDISSGNVDGTKGET